ncbi:MAG: hypothetical protein JWP58_1409 [Hymenobacter sp.]|nr:hypothetical protein [Hymenobacter sp.]
MAFFDNMSPLPGWLLRIAESSNGHFTVSLTDESKRRVASTCTDTELPVKLQECVDWAKKIRADDHVRNDDSVNG